MIFSNPPPSTVVEPAPSYEDWGQFWLGAVWSQKQSLVVRMTVPQHMSLQYVGVKKEVGP